MSPGPLARRTKTWPVSRRRRTAAEAVAAGVGATPVVLCIPSPARWLLLTAEQADQEAMPPDPDRADTVAMYIAYLLRIFAGDGLLLHEGPHRSAT